jgi:hypothetical protein
MKAFPQLREGNQQINRMHWKPLSVWTLAPIETVGRNIQIRLLVSKRAPSHVWTTTYNSVEHVGAVLGFDFKTKMNRLQDWTP